MRLINADEIQYAKDWVVTDKIPKVGGYNAKAIYRVTKEEIDAMPTVDAAPVKHGRWIETKHGFCCNQCHTRRPLDWDGQMWLSSFCPNCGARTDGKDSDHEKADRTGCGTGRTGKP